MIVDYNKDKRVRITKPGIFDNAIGTIKSIKVEVDLGSQGLWSFKHDEMELVQAGFKEVLTKSDKQEIKDAADKVKPIVEKIVKRAYTKREPKASDKPKQKRAYNKKAKS